MHFGGAQSRYSKLSFMPVRHVLHDSAWLMNSSDTFARVCSRKKLPGGVNPKADCTFEPEAFCVRGGEIVGAIVRTMSEARYALSLSRPPL